MLLQQSTGNTNETNKKFAHQKLNLHMQPHPLHPMWDIPRPEEVTQEHELQPGQVDMFDRNRGFGFIECGEGRLFFHASGFRLPLPDRFRLTLAQAVKPDANGKVGRIPIPEVQVGMRLLFKSGRRKLTDKHQALYWCLQDVYESTLADLRQAQIEELDHWRRLGRYRLVLCERKERGKCNISRTNLFTGTHVEFLKGLFVSCLERYGAGSADRWLELAFQVQDENGTYLPWEICDTATMTDFMNS